MQRMGFAIKLGLITGAIGGGFVGLLGFELRRRTGDDGQWLTSGLLQTFTLLGLAGFVAGLLTYKK